MKRLLIIHPFLFVSFPIIFLYAHNIDRASVGMLWVPAILGLLTTALLWFLLNLILRNWLKSGLIVSLWLWLFFSYGQFLNALKHFRFSIGGAVIGPNKLLLSALVISAILGTIVLLKARRELRNLTKLANFFGIFLIAISLFNIIKYSLTAKRFPRDFRAEAIHPSGSTVGAGAGEYPDIYYVILDAYANAAVLQEIFDYNNQPFINYLEEIGFFVVPEGHSNYGMTTFSLASSLNMSYLNYLTEVMGAESDHVRYVQEELLQNNKVVQYLKSKGYRFINIGSGWPPTDRNQNADLNLQCTKVNEFVMILFQSTLLKPLAERFIETDIRKRILYAFDQSSRISRKKGPNFVFAHLMLPHPPFVFGPQGEPIPKTKIEMTGEIWSERSRYVNQLIFTNTLVKTVLNRILKASPPPLVIIQADHGPFFTGRPEEPPDPVLRERLGILNAYYVPASVRKHLYDSITPVNSFRLLLKYYFGETMEMVEDSCYYSTYRHPYRFIDVTNRLPRGKSATP